MKKLFSILTVSLFITTSAATLAADNSMSDPGGATPSSQYNTQSQVSTASQGETLELKNGTKIQVNADSTVQKMNSDGSQSALADGRHKLSDGSTITVKDGKKVNG